MRTLMLAAAAGLLAACATATPYQSAESGRGYGFQEQMIEQNRVRISFRGNTLTDRDTVENYLLYRAAEITIENGKDYFIVANRDTEGRSRLQAVGPMGPRFAFDWYYSPRRAGLVRRFWAEPQLSRGDRYEATARSRCSTAPAEDRTPSTRARCRPICRKRIVRLKPRPRAKASGLKCDPSWITSCRRCVLSNI